MEIKMEQVITPVATEVAKPKHSADMEYRLSVLKQNAIKNGAVADSNVSTIRQDNSTATTNMTTASGFANASGLPMGGFHVIVGEIFQRVYPALISQHIFANIVSDMPFTIVRGKRRIYDYALLNGVRLSDVIKSRDNEGMAASLGMTVEEVQSIVDAYEMGAFEAVWNGGDQTAGYSGGYGVDGSAPALEGQGQTAWNLRLDGDATDPTTRAGIAARQADAAATSAIRKLVGNLATITNLTTFETATTYNLTTSAGGTIAAGAYMPLDILNTVNFIMSQTAVILTDVYAVADYEIVVSAAPTARYLQSAALDDIETALSAHLATVTWSDIVTVLQGAYAGSLRTVVGAGANIFNAESWKLIYEPFWLRATQNAELIAGGVEWPAQGMNPVDTLPVSGSIDPITGRPDALWAPESAEAIFRNDNWTRALGLVQNYMRKGDEFPQLATIYDSQDVKLKSRKLGASFTIEELQFAESLHGIREKESMMETIMEEIKQNQDREAIALAKRLAVNFAKGGGALLTVDLNDMSTLPGASGSGSNNAIININSIENRVIKLVGALNLGVQTVQRKTRIGKGGGILTTAAVVSALMSAGAYFTSLSNVKGVDIDTSSAGDCLVGYVNGTIPVYLDQFADEDYALAFVKGSGQHAGIIRVDYNVQASWEAIDPTSGASRIGVALWYGFVDNLLSAGNYYRLMKFRNLSAMTGSEYGRVLGW